MTGDSVELAYVDQGYTGADAEIAAADEGIDLEVVKLAEAERGFVLLPRRWVVELLAWRWAGAVPPVGEELRATDRDVGGVALRRL